MIELSGRTRALLLLWTALSLACKEDTSPHVGCSINSDCNAPLICALGRCHTQCQESRDCDSNARCVMSPAGGVCTVPEEWRCAADCLGALVCASDQRCRNNCQGQGQGQGQGKDQCIAGQTCAAGGVCADPKDVDSEGKLLPPPAVDAGAGGGGSSGSPPAGPGGFLYVGGNGSGASRVIAIYALAAQTGAPTLVGTAAVGGAVLDGARDPRGKFLYFAIRVSGIVEYTSFAIDRTSGGLARVATTRINAYETEPMQAHPEGSWLSVGPWQTRQLVPIAEAGGFGMAVPIMGVHSTGIWDVAGKHLYTFDQREVAQLSFDSASGMTSPAGMFALGGGFAPVAGVLAHPSGNWIYSNAQSGYDIGFFVITDKSTGQLTEQDHFPEPIAAGGVQAPRIDSLLLHPKGNLLFARGSAQMFTDVYAVGDNGRLRFLRRVTETEGRNAAASVSNDFLYLAGTTFTVGINRGAAEAIKGYRVNPNDGTLSALGDAIATPPMVGAPAFVMQVW